MQINLFNTKTGASVPVEVALDGPIDQYDLIVDGVTYKLSVDKASVDLATAIGSDTIVKILHGMIQPDDESIKQYLRTTHGKHLQDVDEEQLIATIKQSTSAYKEMVENLKPKNIPTQHDPNFVLDWLKRARTVLHDDERNLHEFFVIIKSMTPYLSAVHDVTPVAGYLGEMLVEQITGNREWNLELVHDHSYWKEDLYAQRMHIVQELETIIDEYQKFYLAKKNPLTMIEQLVSSSPQEEIETLIEVLSDIINKKSRSAKKLGKQLHSKGFHVFCINLMLVACTDYESEEPENKAVQFVSGLLAVIQDINNDILSGNVSAGPLQMLLVILKKYIEISKEPSKILNFDKE